jgi:hypothetical protein
MKTNGMIRALILRIVLSSIAAEPTAGMEVIGAATPFEPGRMLLERRLRQLRSGV